MRHKKISKHNMALIALGTRLTEHKGWRLLQELQYILFASKILFAMLSQELCNNFQSRVVLEFDVNVSVYCLHTSDL